MDSGNLFQGIPAQLPAEITQSLLCSGRVRIERIVSQGQSSEPGFWYDQDENEWVALLQGAAGLRFEEGGAVLDLKPGDYVNIPAHVRHRVEWTRPDCLTVWLAVFY